MLEKIVVIIIAYLAYIGIIISIPLRKKSTEKHCGSCLLSFSKPVSKRNYVILVVAALLIPLIYFFTYKFYVDIAIAGCGVVGAYIAAKEITFSDLYGVYENGFCAGGLYIPYEKLSSINAVDSKDGTNTTVRIVYKKGETQSLTFASESEKNIILKKLKELKVL